MEPYEIAFQPSVEKDLRKLSGENRDRILTRIEALAQNPLPAQVIKLKGTEGLYRIRVGDYRIIYEIDPAEHSILIHYVRHRRDVYRDFNLMSVQHPPLEKLSAPGKCRSGCKTQSTQQKP